MERLNQASPFFRTFRTLLFFLLEELREPTIDMRHVQSPLAGQGRLTFEFEFL